MAAKFPEPPAAHPINVRAKSATNEEWVTSTEELQSLKAELTSLNSQLQETLARQRTTSDDLQNILSSTEVATIFFDRRLNIRFFTPATKMIFNFIPSDIGRPLADLGLLASDGSLLGDAEGVLRTHDPVEREIEITGSHWYIRRIFPYREENNRVGGVVITFSDITDLKRAAKGLEAAKLEAEVATLAKTRLLAVASHELRQPLQTLVLLQGLLVRKVESNQARKLVARVGETLSSMSDMLNTVLDLDEAGSKIAVQVTEPSAALNTSGTVVFIVDDDRNLRTALRDSLEGDGRCVEDFATCEAFLASYRPGREACLLVDAYLPGMSGLQLLERLRAGGDQLPAIMITGRSDVQIAVKAMKAGAVDFIEKPILPAELTKSVERALAVSRDVNQRAVWKALACDQIASLTPRQRQIMDMVLDGQPSKNIAADLGISRRTVENHRASIMQRTGAGSLPALARLVLVASSLPRDNEDVGSRIEP